MPSQMRRCESSHSGRDVNIGCCPDEFHALALGRKTRVCVPEICDLDPRSRRSVYRTANYRMVTERVVNR